MSDDPNEFIRGPKWRTRTTRARRHTGATLTAVLIVLFGAAVVTAVTVALNVFGAPGWLVATPWLAPVLGTVVWTLRSPAPAVLSDDDDDSWTGYVIRWVLVGADEPRPVAARVGAALVLGAPIVWSFTVLALIELTGLF